MSREKRQVSYFLNRQIFHFYSAYDPVPFNGKIPESKLDELRKNLYSKGELEIIINENTTKALLIEKFLVDIYKIYKKNPKDYNKLIELEKKIIHLFFIQI